MRQASSRFAAGKLFQNGWKRLKQRLITFRVKIEKNLWSVEIVKSLSASLMFCCARCFIKSVKQQACLFSTMKFLSTFLFPASICVWMFDGAEKMQRWGRIQRKRTYVIRDCSEICAALSLPTPAHAAKLSAYKSGLQAQKGQGFADGSAQTETVTYTKCEFQISWLFTQGNSNFPHKFHCISCPRKFRRLVIEYQTCCFRFNILFQQLWRPTNVTMHFTCIGREKNYRFLLIPQQRQRTHLCENDLRKVSFDCAHEKSQVVVEMVKIM